MAPADIQYSQVLNMWGQIARAKPLSQLFIYMNSSFGTDRDKQGQKGNVPVCSCLCLFVPAMSLLVPALSLLVPACPYAVPGIDWHNW